MMASIMDARGATSSETVATKWGRPALILVFLASVLAALWRFLPWMPAVFYGDDLDYLLSFKDGQCATRAAEILTTTCYERFRPVASGVVIAMMNLFGDRIQAFLFLNVLIQGVIGVLVFAIARRLSRGNWVVALLITLTVVMSRFAAYQVTQMIGPVESLTLALCLGVVYSAVRADTDAGNAWRWSWMALLFSFLAMHSHERSMVTAVWLGLVFVLSPNIRSLPRRRWLALIASCVALPVYYIAFKTYVLKAYFLVGTGGTHLDLGFPLILEHATEAIRSVFGFNTGPDYLVGASVSHAWRLAWHLAQLFSLGWLVVLALGTRDVLVIAGQQQESAFARLRWPLLLLALAGALLAPSLLTVRLEQRWLLAPFTIGMLVVAWATGPAGGFRRLRVGLAVVVCLASLGLDTAIMRYYDRIFFISSPRLAAQVKHDIVDGYPKQHGGVDLLAGADQCSWTLHNGGFFRVYGGRERSTQCFVSVDAAVAAGLAAGTHIYGPDAKNRFIDLTPTPAVQVTLPEGATQFDFLKHFDEGHISDPRHVSTPTGRGVLAMPWASEQGVRDTLTVVSGFTYRYDGIDVPAGTTLRFAVGMIYPAVQPARALVQVEFTGGSKTNIYAQPLSPPAADGKPSFIEVSLPLDAYAGKHISLAFAVDSPGGNSTAHWVGFASPRIVKSAP
jgi:hypothetical protein